MENVFTISCAVRFVLGESTISPHHVFQMRLMNRFVPSLILQHLFQINGVHFVARGRFIAVRSERRSMAAV